MADPTSELLYIIDFEPYVNQSFQIRFPDGITLPAELIKATEVNSFSPIERKPFSIIFRTAQKTEYYQQAICTLHHPEKGELPLFLVPIGFDNQGMKYEAVFS